MRVHRHSQRDVVLERRLQCAEQEGETTGGFECTADLSVSVAAEARLGDAQVGRVVLVRDEEKLDRGGVGWVITFPGEADASVGLDHLHPDLARGPVHLPLPGQLGARFHSPAAFRVPESRRDRRVGEGLEHVVRRSTDEHAGVYRRLLGQLQLHSCPPLRSDDALVSLNLPEDRLPISITWAPPCRSLPRAATSGPEQICEQGHSSSLTTQARFKLCGGIGAAFETFAPWEHGEIGRAEMLPWALLVHDWDGAEQGMSRWPEPERRC